MKRPRVFSSDRMTPVRQSIWTGVGWAGIGLVIAAPLFAILDPVLTGFALYLAIVVGGLSSIGKHSTTKFAVITIVLSLLVMTGASHYATTTGFGTPSVSSMLSVVLILGPALLVSLGLVIWGVVRRASEKEL